MRGEKQDSSSSHWQIEWSYERTVDQIVLSAPPDRAREGDSPSSCDFVRAGKSRNGRERWWCRRHLASWGSQQDVRRAERLGAKTCCLAHANIEHVSVPMVIDLERYEEVGIWCSLPPAISTRPIVPRSPRIHVHVRNSAEGEKIIDRDFRAIAVLANQVDAWKRDGNDSYVAITPPAAFDYVCAQLDGRPLCCVSCPRCDTPHLDLGDFARRLHRKHTCGQCGHDFYSPDAAISSPLHALASRVTRDVHAIVPPRTLDLDEFQGCSYTVWGSTPAVLWTARRPQEIGIHVHVEREGRRVVDETFGTVLLNGRPLQREELLSLMRGRVQATLRNTEDEASSDESD